MSNTPSLAPFSARPALRLHLLCLFALLCGATSCSDSGPMMTSASDVRALDAGEVWVKARALPDQDIHSLTRLRALRFLDFSQGSGVMRAGITDRGLETLSRLPLHNLESLSLSHNDNITDLGLAHVSKMQALDSLQLAACPNLTDRGLHAIAAMKELRYLDLRGCPGFTNGGLATLAASGSLSRIVLDGCDGITEQGVEELRSRMPGAVVSKDDDAWSYLQRP